MLGPADRSGGFNELEWYRQRRPMLRGPWARSTSPRLTEDGRPGTKAKKSSNRTGPRPPAIRGQDRDANGKPGPGSQVRPGIPPRAERKGRGAHRSRSPARPPVTPARSCFTGSAPGGAKLCGDPAKVVVHQVRKLTQPRGLPGPGPARVGAEERNGPRCAARTSWSAAPATNGHPRHKPVMKSGQ